MSRRLPATWSALSEGTIDLGRAELIDLWTTPLDDDLAQAVERKVLPGLESRPLASFARHCSAP